MSLLTELLKGYADPTYKTELLGKGSLDNTISDLLEDAVEAGHRIEALEAALREIATTVSTSREPFLIKLAVIGNVARAALDKDTGQCREP
jgi:hypothetical protein